MTARTLMRSDLLKLRTTDTVAAAAQILLQHHLRHLPVVDEQDRYAGTFGLYSIMQLALPAAVFMEEGLDNVAFVNESHANLVQRLHERDHELVTNWLLQPPFVYPDTPSMQVIKMMLQSRTSIPVVSRDQHVLEGMISSADVLHVLINEEN